ncbi:MAG: acyltransferase [Oscillospiraceae bacterium]|jgi:peptidoglycan/LPS O-acetylase OafA/YrhL|nr:acyltransferase [Oscillospiraceae bacterium]
MEAVVFNPDEPLAPVTAPANALKPPKKEYFYALDALRGFAAMAVAFFCHYVPYFSKSEADFKKALFLFPVYEQVAMWLRTNGWLAVDFFFCLSGFIFYHMYKEKIAERRIELKDFAVLRISRLFPLHWLALGVVVVVRVLGVLTGDGKIVWYKAVNSNLLSLLQTTFLFQAFRPGEVRLWNDPAWSLSFEFIGYFIFFLVIWLMGKSKNTKKNSFLFLLAPILIGLAALQFGWNQLPFFGVVNGRNEGERFLVSFFIGCIAYEIYKRCKENKKLQGIVAAVSAALIVGLVALQTRPDPNKLFGNWLVVFQLLVMPSIILLVVNCRPLNKFLSLGLFRWLGNLSFSIYLWHFPIILTMRYVSTLMGTPWAFTSRRFFWLYVLLTLVIAHCSHYYFERPMQALIRKKYFARKREKELASVAD